ncbi:MAG TPA: sugar phosphate isomerase/epimerase family protein [candidate division Zixibacteria bacterium]|nr:sugar phosphate isomerase/epimerase family protein [candidate division Zixibacteria bacterium]
MLVAISSLLFKSRNLADVIDLARAQGIPWLEVWTEHLHRDDDGSLLEKLRRCGLGLSVHGPIGDLNITSANAGIRAESVKQVEQAIEEAARMGARIITVHPGHLTGSKDPPESIWERQVEALSRFARRGKEVGIQVAMETMERRDKEVVIDPEAANRIVDAVGLDNFGITFDISHAHTVMDVGEFIGALRRITHIHISDTRAGKTHVQMGEGEISFPAVLRRLEARYDGPLVIEGWQPRDEAGMVRRSVAFLSEQLEQLEGI